MSKVPKIIHQIMHNFAMPYPPVASSQIVIPEKWAKSPVEWKRLHPGWTLRLWGEYESRELVKNKYPQYLEIYDACKYNIQRVDMIRYFILHAYGGIYSDLDSYPTEAIDKYIDGNVEVYFSYGPIFITNSFIASVKGAPIWLKVFEGFRDVKIPFWANFTMHFYVLITTGPMFLDKIVKNYEDGTTGRLSKLFMNHEAHKCNHRRILLPLKGMSWCGLDTHIFNFIGNNIKALAVLGFILAILLIIVFVYFIIRSVKFKKLFAECNAGLKKCSMSFPERNSN